MNHVFTERADALSSFITFNQPIDLLELQAAQSADDIPHLTYLRVECIRTRNGMNDFIIRVATPKFEDKTNTVLSLRGGRSLAKNDGSMNLAKLIVEEMKKREDKAFAWEKIDLEHLSKMLMIPVKLFSVNTNMHHLAFSTEALQ